MVKPRGRFRVVLVGIVCVVASVVVPTSAGQTSSVDAVHVSVVADPGPAADSLVRRVDREVRRLFAGRQPVRISVTRGDDPWTANAARAAHQSATRTPSDVVVVVGPIAATAVCTRAAGRRDAETPPTIAVSTGSGLLAPNANATTCQVVGPAGWPGASMRAFQRLSAFDALTVVVDARVVDHVDDATRRITRRADRAGVRVDVVPIQEAPTGARIARGATDAVFLDHVDRLPTDVVEAVTDSLAARRMPVFAHDAVYAEAHGALAAPQTVAAVRARAVALAVESTRMPTPATDDATTNRSTPTSRSETPLVVNSRVASSLGVAIPIDVQMSARLVASPASGGDGITLAAAMHESIRANLQLQAKRQQVAADANRVDVARARLLPQANASASAQAVSEDVAAASFGAQPERQLTSTVSVRQVLLDEAAFAGLSVERRMQAVREFERQSVRLDAAKSAGDAYLSVLQARAAVAIQRENVQAVRTSLDAARTRRDAGAADPREVTRLETAHAQAEQGLVEAMGRARAAEIQFNRVLNRPLDASVALDQTTGVDPTPVLQRFPYPHLLDDAGERQAFTRFWVEEAQHHAPEVQAVDRLVSARKRQATSAHRAFWMPEVAVEGQFTQRVAEGGTGASGSPLPLPGSGSGGGAASIPTPPDQQWSVGLTATFPLFRGTERAAQRRRATGQLEASRTERMMTRLGVEQRVRTALVHLETAHAAVERAQRAAASAQRTLDVTQAAYREGTATLVDLIDAQTAALTTRQRASNAAYGLLRDWLSVQRAGGSFRVLRTPREQTDFQARLQSMMADSQTPGSASPHRLHEPTPNDR